MSSIDIDETMQSRLQLVLLYSCKVTLFVTLMTINPIASLGEELVLPNAADSMDMNEANQWPFIRPTFAPLRFQQVYEGRLFEHVGSPIRISEIAFRPDTVFGMTLSGTISDISLSLSTTQRDEFSLSFTDLDSNVGSDTVEVYARQSLFVSTDFLGGNPKEFDFVISFDNDFVFDPKVGNLLLEINNHSAEKLIDTISSGYLDASSVAGQGIARAWSFLPTAPGYGTDSSGLVTRFSYVRVPESSSFVAGIVLVLVNALIFRLPARDKQRRRGTSSLRGGLRSARVASVASFRKGKGDPVLILPA